MSYKLYQKVILHVGQAVQWTDNSSYDAHQNRVIFRVNSIVQNDKPLKFIISGQFGQYTLSGIALRKETNGTWSDASGHISVTWVYNQTVGGGFPLVLENI